MQSMFIKFKLFSSINVQFAIKPCPAKACVVEKYPNIVISQSQSADTCREKTMSKKLILIFNIWDVTVVFVDHRGVHDDVYPLRVRADLQCLRVVRSL